MDGDGEPVAERRIGELLVRGDAVTPGYLTEAGPLASADEQGWLHTGDLGYLAEGEVVVCGRIKDVIILAGRNVYPTDIERVTATVDGVRPGNVAAVRLEAGTRRERFAVVAESAAAGDEDAEADLAQRVTARLVDVMGCGRPRYGWSAPGACPRPPRASSAGRRRPRT